MGKYFGISVTREKIIGRDIKDGEMKKAVCTLQEKENTKV